MTNSYSLNFISNIESSLRILIGPKHHELMEDSQERLKNELEETLLGDLNREVEERLEEEIRLVRKAERELRNSEQQLFKPSQTQYYSGSSLVYGAEAAKVMFYVLDDKEMLESEFKKWHDRQVKKEDALKMVEDQVRTNYQQEV